MRLIELGSKRLAIAFALGLAGAIAACGGDDNNGNPDGGGGGTGGTSQMDAKGGGGTTDAAPDTSAETGPGGSGGTAGTGGSDATGMGGSGTGDARPDIVIDDGPRPGSDANDASAAPDVSDGGTTTPDSSDEPVTPPTDDGPQEMAPPVNDATPGTSVLYSFNFNAGNNYGWRAMTGDTDNGTVVGIAEGAPNSTGGSIEWSGTIDPNGTVVFIQYGADDGTGATRTDLADVQTLQLEVRLHNPADASTDGLSSITLQFVGSANTGYATSSGDYLDPGTGQQWDDFLAGAWTPLNVTVGARMGDGGPNNADLWRIAVQLNGTMDAGATPLVLDVDNVTVTR